MSATILIAQPESKTSPIGAGQQSDQYHKVPVKRRFTDVANDCADCGLTTLFAIEQPVKRTKYHQLRAKLSAMQCKLAATQGQLAATRGQLAATRGHFAASSARIKNTQAHANSLIHKKNGLIAKHKKKIDYLENYIAEWDHIHESFNDWEYQQEQKAKIAKQKGLIDMQKGLIDSLNIELKEAKEAKVEQEVMVCNICFDTKVDTVLSSCGHTMCRGCFENMPIRIRQTHGDVDIKIVECPWCRRLSPAVKLHI